MQTLEPITERFLTISETATYLGLGRSKVYDLIGRGELRSATFDRARRVPLSSLVDFTQRRMSGSN